jgi:TetR/AcrR family transcriptional repressor of nem operon
MGRPTKFDRGQAVELAMQEIWRNGYRACSTKSLSEKIGITRSSFYNAFGSREELFREVMTLYAQHCPDAILMTQAHVDGSVLQLLTDTFRDVCHARAIDPEAKGCMAINSVVELIGTDPDIGEEIRQMAASGADHLERLLRVAAENGEIADNGDLRAKALALQNLMIGLQIMAKFIRSEEELWSSASTTLKGLGFYAEPLGQLNDGQGVAATKRHG